MITFAIKRQKGVRYKGMQKKRETEPENFGAGDRLTSSLRSGGSG